MPRHDERRMLRLSGGSSSGTEWIACTTDETGSPWKPLCFLKKLSPYASCFMVRMVCICPCLSGGCRVSTLPTLYKKANALPVAKV